MPTDNAWARRARLAVGALTIALLAASCSSKPSAVRSSSSASGPVPSASAPAPSPSGPAASPSASPAPGSAPPETATTPPPPALAWTTCGSPYQCSTIKVPLDWSQPTAGPTVSLALIRLTASGAQSQRLGPLFVNPGGPGASAVDFVRNIGQYLSGEVLRRFDIIGFDPRGVGGSEPLNCLSGAAMDAYLSLDPAPSTPAQINALVAASKAFGAACAKQYGPAFLQHVDTLDAARDMDYIRQALGSPTLTYVGYSYGTFLGAQYAGLFPTHIRAMALDGAVDPSVSGLGFDAAQAAGFDDELGDFFANCGNSGCAYSAGGNARAAFVALESRIKSTPLKVGNRELDLSLFINGVADGLYSPNSWTGLASALEEAVRGNGSALLTMSDDLTGRNPNGSYQAIASAIAAVNCVDSPYPTDVAAYQSAAAAAEQRAPIFGADIVWSSLVCAYWPVPPAITPAPIHADGAPPILVIGTTGDPATPYPMAVSLASQLSSGVLLTHDGLGHTSAGQDVGQFDDCVNQATTTYLISLTPPANGSVCGNNDAAPSPSPTPATIAYRP